MAWFGAKSWCVLTCAFAIGCADEDANDEGASSAADDDDASASASASDDDTTASTSGATQSSVSDGDTSGDDSATATDPSDSISTEGTDTVADSTTGDELYCGLADLEGGPWFEIGHAGAPLADGSVLTIECGGQGSLMFYLETQVGGWMPLEDSVFYSVTVDVDGHVGPSGHFFQDMNFGEYIGCEEFEGGAPPEGITVIPPDDLGDPTVLHGLTATIHVELLAGDNPTFDATVELAVPADDPSIVECMGFG
jgi:hypothetical protein